MNAKNKQANDAQNNAPAAYQAHASDIAKLIDVLQMELDKHADAAKADPKNWGRAGDLGKVRSDLMELVSFLSGMERPAIESFLAE